MKQKTESIGSFCNHSHKLSNGDHLCKFYDSSITLMDSLCDFVVPGITRGEGIIIIATPTHSANLMKALENRSIDIARAQAKGQLILLDAKEVLGMFMNNGLPQPDKFYKIINAILLPMQKNYPRIRAYGEMVDILVKQNQVEATIQLENLWNEVCSKNHLSLLCGYESKFFNKDNDNIFKAICATHNHLVAKGELQRI